MKRRVQTAITGANGFVGSHLAAKFLEKGYDVTGLVRANADLSIWDYLNLNNCTQTDKGKPHLRKLTVDYNNIEELLKAFNEADIVIHNAAITRGRSKDDYIKHNVLLTEKVIEAVNNTKSVKHFIFISSQAAAGACKTSKKETEICTPVSHYGESKYLAEQLVIKKCRKDRTIVRPCSVYGPADRDFLPYFKMVDKKLSLIAGIKKRYFSLISVSELSEYVASIAGNPAAFGETFFLSDGYRYSWDDFVDSLAEIMDKNPIRLRLPLFFVIPFAILSELTGLLTKRVPLVNWQKSKEIRACHWVCDSSKAEKLLSLPAGKQSLKENLKKTYEWYKEKKWL